MKQYLKTNIPKMNHKANEGFQKSLLEVQKKTGISQISNPKQPPNRRELLEKSITPKMNHKANEGFQKSLLDAQKKTGISQISNPKQPLTRRELLEKSIALGTILAIGVNFIATIDGAFALDVKNLKPSTMATIVQLARDIYPHDRIATQYYMAAVKPYDDDAKATDIENFIAKLNENANGDYLALGWEAQRVSVLRKLEDEPMFQTIRAGLVTGLYNQKSVWPIFGYEGESYSKGGYLYRGFDDINWL